MMYTPEQVNAALNAAADDVLTAAGAPDTGMRDAVNLVVNAALTYLEDSDAELSDVAAGNYDVPLDEILGWIDS